MSDATTTSTIPTGHLAGGVMRHPLGSERLLPLIAAAEQHGDMETAQYLHRVCIYLCELDTFYGEYERAMGKPYASWGTPDWRITHV